MICFDLDDRRGEAVPEGLEALGPAHRLERRPQVLRAGVAVGVRAEHEIAFWAIGADSEQGNPGGLLRHGDQVAQLRGLRDAKAAGLLVSDGAETVVLLQAGDDVEPPRRAARDRSRRWVLPKPKKPSSRSSTFRILPTRAKVFGTIAKPSKPR
ncbi:hypothetical protein [Streptomyces sp. NPDC058279]|uniref:hypothetical protein n=1 Tax=Streptomyces sp. NPDC058279 TaxID=3346418 RepID=UPI0036EED1D8